VIKPQVGCVVGLPCSRNVMPEWAVSIATQNWPTDMNPCFVPVRSTKEHPIPIANARNYIVEGALDLEAPYIWFIDDDVQVPFLAARYLLSALKQAPDDVMVMGGIYPCRQNPPEPIVYQGNGVGAFWKWKAGSIFDCTLIGTGCMMIKAEVFKHLPKPWFKTVDSDLAKITDDAWFCDKVLDAGFRIQAHGGVICHHWDNEHGICYSLPADSYPFQDIEPPKAPSFLVEMRPYVDQTCEATA
jgi:hypothetical protein